MPQDRVNSFNGATHLTDTAPTPNALVDRDTNGLAQVISLTASGSASKSQLLGAVYEGGAAFTTLATLTNTSPRYCEANGTGGAFNLTLPPASTSANQIFHIIKTDSSGNAVGFAPAGSDDINGANSAVTTSTQWAHIAVRCNAAGTAWYEI